MLPSSASTKSPVGTRVPPPTQTLERCQGKRPKGRIAYASSIDGDFEIFVMDASGDNKRQLTFNDVDDIHPSWSPDGTKLVFVGLRDAEYSYKDLFIIGADGSGLQPITFPGRRVGSTIRDEDFPEWSPDGRSIAFESSSDSDGSDIAVYDLSSGRSRIVYGSNEGIFNFDPSWAPSSQRLAFIEAWDPDHIYISRLNNPYPGTQIFEASGRYTNLISPTWSPDGKLIAVAMGAIGPYFDDIPGGSVHLQIVASDGASSTQVIGHPGPRRYRPPEQIDSLLPGDWSPDGSHLVVYSNSGGSYDIYTMCVDGSQMTQLTDDYSAEVHPSWAPAEHR